LPITATFLSIFSLILLIRQAHNYRRAHVLSGVFFSPLAGWLEVGDIPRRTIIKSLQRKGFTRTKKKGDHDWYVFCHGGQEYGHVMAKISRGSSYKTYSESLWTRMKTLLALDTNAEAHGLLTCPVDHAAYVNVLKRKKIIR